MTKTRTIPLLGVGALATLLAGCPSVADLTWTGPGEFGAVRSAEWIRYTVTSDITFSGQLTLNYFVLSSLPNFCNAYQDAVGAAFDAHQSYVAARQIHEDGGTLRSAESCASTREYNDALASATEEVAAPGTAYVSTSFGYAGVAGTANEEGAPQEGTFNLTNDPTAEDGDFFRTFVRFIDENPYAAARDALDCSDPAWGDDTNRLGYEEFRAEPRVGDPENEGRLRSEFSDDDLVHLAHEGVLAVSVDRDHAGLLDTNGEYLLCELTTQRFFLRVFER